MSEQIKIYRKKPVVIEAIQWNGNSNKSEIEQFIGKELKAELESETAYVAGKGAPIFSLLIETKEGIMKAFQNDWIIKEPFPTGDRDFYPCKPDIFAKTYEEVKGLLHANISHIEATEQPFVGGKRTWCEVDDILF
ncbi:MAG: hypothetical protein WCQ70_09880 [Lentimicrobiaceae bacterium]